jgi:prepilin-type N-terminal cleavage/methylation domain-containing protein
MPVPVLDFEQTLIYHKQSRRGQSLIEVMIAMSILTMAFLGIFNLLARSLVINRAVSSEATATYLAAEGVELAKTLIDHDVYAGLANGSRSWGECFGTGGDFEIDYMAQDCPGSPNFNHNDLWYDPTTGLYSYSHNTGSPAETDFTRDVQVQNINDHEIRVNSIVSWSSGTASSSINVEDNFYNWN